MVELFRRLQVRWERDPGRFFAFVLLARALVCFILNSTRSLGQIRGLSGHAADADRAAW
jgi:hypothetical protein